VVKMKFFGAVLFAGVATGLRVPNRTLVASHANSSVPSAMMVDTLHSKLEKMSGALEHMLDSNGALASSKIGPEMKTFVGELHSVLNETSGMSNRTAAFEKLLAAKAGLAGLTADLTSRQVSIMKEEESQKDSLLLGVLMTHQKDPMAKQLEILKSDDFAVLPVSKALLAKHNETALFAQAANYLDTHATKGVKISIGLKDAASVKADQQKTAARLQKSVDSLQTTFDARSKSHEKRMLELNGDVKKAKGVKSQRVMQSIEKREERNFKKWAAMQNHDIDAMKSAVAAVKKGDLKALGRAQAALQASMNALKNKNSGFLVLLSLGHQLMEQDCPYCAAQCVDTCHQAGKPYTQCLTDCADAGKGK